MINKIFIIEDDEWYGEYLKYQLSLNIDYSITLFRKASECLKNINLSPDVIITDLNLPGMSGEDLFLKLNKVCPEVPVIIISSQTEIQKALNLIRNGAYEYVFKDNNAVDFIRTTLKKINETLHLKSEIKTLQSQLNEKYKVSNLIIGNSPVLEQTFHYIEKASNSNINVTITGETGTGKELVAKAIHYNSNQKNKKFVAINMSAIPDNLLESELFGYEKGAFTGANTSKVGKFEEANNGTLFLDEIADLTLNLQSKILRALQEKEITRLGGNNPIKLNLRLITASHKDLLDEVKNGSFREDLYYRISGLPINLPPLRERNSDIILISNHFIKEYCKENKIKSIKLTNEAKKKLLNYYYPGNIRELKSIIDLACLLSFDNIIDAEHIQFNQQSNIIPQNFNTNKSLKEYEEEIILNHLKINNNNVINTARKLKISKSKIYNILKEIKIDGSEQ